MLCNYLSAGKVQYIIADICLKLEITKRDKLQVRA